jgi:hypothetical protein
MRAHIPGRYAAVALLLGGLACAGNKASDNGTVVAQDTTQVGDTSAYKGGVRDTTAMPADTSAQPMPSQVDTTSYQPTPAPADTSSTAPAAPADTSSYAPSAPTSPTDTSSYAPGAPTDTTGGAMSNDSASAQ